MDEVAMRRELLFAFDYSYQHDDWVNPLAEALAGVTAAEAAWKPGPGVKGIWDIVLPMAVLLCRFIHNAYHIGQITKLRELRAAPDAAA